jgi:hypothetical protein
MQSKSRKYETMLEDHVNLWVNEETSRMYAKTNGTWQRIPRIYHPAHNVECDGKVEPGVSISNERDWWYDNDTGIWWCSAKHGFRVARQSIVPSRKLHDKAWTSPDHVQYTAVLYNTIQHYQLHCDNDEVPCCIQFEATRVPKPSFEHPTSLLLQHGEWVPNRPIYFGVPSREPQCDDEQRDRRCSKCWWYLSTVSVGSLEAEYHMETSNIDKTQILAFGPFHLDTIVGLHQNFGIDDVWIAPSDALTPPSYHQFKYKLVDAGV